MLILLIFLHKNTSLVDILSCLNKKTSGFFYIFCKKATVLSYIMFENCVLSADKRYEHNDPAQNDPVITKHLKIILLNISHQETDRNNR